MSRFSFRGFSVAIVLMLCGGCAASTAASRSAVTPDVRAGASPDEKQIEEAQRQLVQHRPADAIQTLTPLLDKLGEPNLDPKGMHSYCTRSMEETVLYMLQAQSQGWEAVALEPTWAEAYYLKGYALIELGQLDEAKDALGKALTLSPENSSYLSELGHVAQMEKNWAKALQLFTQAEAAVRYSPSDLKTTERTRALRGQGYSLTELGRLNEAEARYSLCVDVDHGDFAAKRELEYIEQQRQNPR
jgi:tetratricopeptide (TPR) repeat protein